MPSVLLVEDETIIAMEIQHRLESRGCRILGPVGTGSEAVAVARSEQPDLIIMDIGLRGRMSGIEAAEKILEENRVPIVFMSAWTDPKTVERIQSIDHYGFVSKPFREREILEVIEKTRARPRDP